MCNPAVYSAARNVLNKAETRLLSEGYALCHSILYYSILLLHETPTFNVIDGNNNVNKSFDDQQSDWDNNKASRVRITPSRLRYYEPTEKTTANKAERQLNQLTRQQYIQDTVVACVGLEQQSPVRFWAPKCPNLPKRCLQQNHLRDARNN